MAKVQILYWQEIPSVVEARDDKGVFKKQLSDRYQQLIDHIAMMRNLAGTDGYLEQWNKGSAAERTGDAQTAALQAAEELEARFDQIKSQAIASTRGG
jgi:Virulence factor